LGGAPPFLCTNLGGPPPGGPAPAPLGRWPAPPGPAPPGVDGLPGGPPIAGGLAAPAPDEAAALSPAAAPSWRARSAAPGPSGREPSAAEPCSPEDASRRAPSAAAGRGGDPSPPEGSLGGPGLLALLRAMKRLSRMREADGTAAERTEPSRPSIFVEPLQAPPGAGQVRVGPPGRWRARPARGMAAPRQR
jgi:hypothetical protein